MDSLPFAPSPRRCRHGYRLTAAVKLMALLLALVQPMSITPAHAEPAVLAADGDAKARIYISQPIEFAPLTGAQLHGLPAEERAPYLNAVTRRHAINDLIYHLEQMTGASFEVVVTDEPDDVTAPALVFGDLAVALGAEPQHATKTGDAFRLIVRDDGVVLFGGESDVAASHAMYHWLSGLGCFWFMPSPDGEVIPTVETLTVEPMDVAKAPAFKVRTPWYSGGPHLVTKEEHEQLAQWNRRLGQTHHRFAQHPDFLQGGHMWASMLSVFKDEFKNDPSMLAQIRQPDGTFAPGRAQLEPTHPGVVDLTVRYIRRHFERRNLPKDAEIAMSIGPNDGGGYSESVETFAASPGRTDPITGAPDETDVLILYANRVLEAVAEEFPNLKLGFYIYSVHADYPMRHQPDPRFVAHFADITYSRYHSLLDRNSYSRNYYRGILEQWKKLHETQGNPLWFYGYNWNLAENLFPYTKARIWGEDLPYYHAMGVIGHNNEQDKAWSILGPHNYIMARMGWDIDADWQALLREYCDAVFGDASDVMVRYYLMLDRTQTEAGIESGSFPTVALVLDRAFLERAKALLEEAASAASTPAHQRNVAWFGQSVYMLEHYHAMLDAMHDADYPAAAEHYDAMLDHWGRLLETNPNLVSRYGEHYLRRWFYKPFLDQANQYATGEYRIVHQLPDELPTLLDPENAGQLMGFYEPAMNTDKLLKTQTYRSTWDAQGLGTYRDGGVWYFDRFTVDTIGDGEGVGLLVGGVEDTVHVYLNGQYVGAKTGYIAPDVFDLTEWVKPGEANHLALQVIRRGKINEAGLGGIILPAFIFQGPRLERVAPAVEPMERVLPGGARDNTIQE